MPTITLVDAPPGGKCTVGYHYQVLPPVVENTVVLSGQMGRPIVSSGNADGFQDVGIPQENPEACNEVPVGQK